MTINLLDAHSANGGTSITGGIWNIDSNNTTCNGFNPTLTGDNPSVDFSSISDNCFVTFEYTYDNGSGCPTTDIMQVNVQPQANFLFNQAFYYLCPDETSVDLDISSNYVGTVLLNEFDSNNNIISSQAFNYPSTITVNMLPQGTENVRVFNLEVDGDCGTRTDTIRIFQAPNNVFSNCETITRCEGDTNGIDLNNAITVNPAGSGSSTTTRFRWLSNEQVTLSDGTIINTGDEFKTNNTLLLNISTLTQDAQYQVIVEYNLQGQLVCDIESNICDIEITQSNNLDLNQSEDYLCRWNGQTSYISPQLVPVGDYTVYNTDSSGNILSIYDNNSNGTIVIPSLSQGTYYYVFEDNTGSCNNPTQVFTLYVSDEIQAPTCMEIMACTGESVDLNDGISGGMNVNITYQFTSSPITPIPLIGGSTVNIGDDYLPSMGLIDTSSFNDGDIITYQVTATHLLSDGTECQEVTQSCDVKIMSCVAPCTDYTTAFTTGANTITINHITDSSGIVSDYIATWENLNTGDTFQSANGSYVTATTFDPDTPTVVPVTSGNWQITLVEVDGVEINCLLSNTFMIESSSCDTGGTGTLSYEGPGGITATEFDYTINSFGITNLFVDLFIVQSVPDTLEIIYEGNVIYTTSTSVFNVIVPVTFNIDNFVTIRVSNTDSNVNTIWTLRVECIECNIIEPCPTLPLLSLTNAPTLNNDCALDFSFNDLVFDCNLPSEECSNTSRSSSFETMTKCISSFGNTTCIDENITITSVTPTQLVLDFTNNANAVIINNAINNIAANEILTLSLPNNELKTCVDDGFYNSVRLFNNSITTLVEIP